MCKRAAPAGESEFENACARMGIPEDETDAADDADIRFVVWPANERSVNVFLTVCRQWRVGPMGGYLGLDYQQVEAVLRMRQIKIDAAVLDDLAVMEGGALEVLNAK